MSNRELVMALADGKPHLRDALAARAAMPIGELAAALQVLRDDGLPWQAAGAHGVTLPWPLQLLDAKRVRSALAQPTQSRVANLDVLWEVDSTSSELRRRAAPSGSFLFAEQQSAGRGRRGGVWLAPPGLNICMSCSWHFPGGLRSLAGLSLAVGVMAIDALRASDVHGASIKWPNDVLLGNGKLAGILVEAEGAVDGPCHAIIGIGLNLRVPEAVRRASGQVVADLSGQPAGPPPRNAFAAALVDAVAAGLARFADEGFAAFAAAYAELDVLAGNTLTVHDAVGEWRGSGGGVDERGALRVITDHGVRVLDSANVSVRRA